MYTNTIPKEYSLFPYTFDIPMLPQQISNFCNNSCNYNDGLPLLEATVNNELPLSILLSVRDRSHKFNNPTIIKNENCVNSKINYHKNSTKKSINVILNRHPKCYTTNDNKDVVIRKNIIFKQNQVYKNGGWQCPECSKIHKIKRYTSLKGLRNHYKVHTNEALQCYYCNFVTTKKEQLEKHCIRHKGERKYECKICHKKFKTKQTLKNHKVTHEFAKPWKCRNCSSSFKVKHNLVKHEKIHDPERPAYFCTHCSKKFRSKEGATGHDKKYHGGMFSSIVEM